MPTDSAIPPTGTPPISTSSKKPRPKYLALSIVWHWNPARIGATAAVRENTPITRTSPPFNHDDTIVSVRDPFSVFRVPDGIVIRPPAHRPLRADGVLLKGETHFTSEQLARGIILLINHGLFVALHELTHPPGTNPFPEMVGVSDNLAEVRRFIELERDTMNPVLIRGPSGAGKELVAFALGKGHLPFLNENIASDTDPTMATDSLFGHVPGAYTGAAGARLGLLGHEGTVFLDEIGDIPKQVQTALLKVLDEHRTYRPRGSARFEQCKARIVAATDADLENRVVNGEKFHPPLLFRLQQCAVRLLPLNQRRADIGPIFRVLLEEALKARGKAIPARGPTDEAFIAADDFFALCALPLPGNARDLRTFARATSGRWTGEGHLPLGEFLPDVPLGARMTPSAPFPVPVHSNPRPVSEVTDEAIREAVRTAGSASAASKLLGINRSTLRYRLNRMK